MAIAVPHAAQLPFTLSEGREIIVDGVAGYGDGFSINLCKGPDIEPKTALHFNPRFYQNVVVRNHYNNELWGQTENHGSFPFTKGAAYKVKIQIRNHAYLIFVNNKLFCEFKHQVPKEKCRFLVVKGQTQLSSVTFVHGNIVNPPSPLTSKVPNGVHPGKMIVINGIPTGDSFSVNLLCEPSFDTPSDLSLHAVVRMPQAALIRNHRKNGVWGAEETHQPYFPFLHKVPFELAVFVENSVFKMAVNGQHVAEFHHRLHPVHRADHLHIRGDVRVTQVRFMDISPSTSHLWS